VDNVQNITFVLRLYVEGLTFDPALGWLQSKELSELVS
jgi:hypothetical protein